MSSGIVCLLYNESFWTWTTHHHVVRMLAGVNPAATSLATNLNYATILL